jgi:hypothetical protein
MPEQPQPKIMCVRVTGPEKEIRAFLSEHPLSVESTKREGDLVAIEVFVPEPQVHEIQGKDLKVQVLYDASARGRERQQEVGKGNRFEGENRVPKGLGIKREEGPQ